MKGNGRMFIRGIKTDYKHLKFDLNLVDPVPYVEESGSQLLELADFLKECNRNNYVNYDGFAQGFVLDGLVVWDKRIIPSEAVFYQKALTGLINIYGSKLKIVWYNF